VNPLSQAIARLRAAKVQVEQEIAQHIVRHSIWKGPRGAYSAACPLCREAGEGKGKGEEECKTQ
jgi:hypothetical protein